MNAPVTPSESQALSTVTTPQTTSLAQSTNSFSMILNPDHMALMFKFAELMAQGVATVPKHLQKNPADCLAVVMQATRWGMDPFAVAQKTHLVSGTLGYEAQLVNAVLQATSAIEGDFSYEFKGSSTVVECRVAATPKGAKELVWGEWLSSATVTTKNSPLWKTNIKQQMGYLQVKNWARLYKPAALLGVYTTDELEIVPRNMGAVELVGINADLLNAAQSAADQGWAALSAWTKAATPAQREALRPEADALKARAKESDAQRTVENAPASAPTPAATPNPEAGEIVMTYAQVLDMMQTAAKKGSSDAMDVAQDWVSAVADKAQQDELNAKCEALRADMAAAS